MLRGRTALMVSLAAGLAVLLLLASDAADPFELPARDAALRLLPAEAASHTIVVAIDEASLQAIGPWPWDRAVLAALVNRVADSRARGVVLDVLLPEPRAGDEQLATAARRLPALAVAVIDDRGRWLAPHPPLAAAMPAAHGSFELDHDGILRRVSATKQSGDRALAALSVEAASLITGAPVPVGTSIAPAFRTRANTIPIVSAASLLDGPSLPDLRDRIVFIGPTALALGDRVLTPTSSRHRADPGVTVHAAATEALIRGESVRELPPIVAALLAAGIVGAIVGANRRRAMTAIVVLLATGGGILALAHGIAIPFITINATAVLALASVEARGMASALRSTEARFVEQRERDAESKRVLAHELKTPLASMRGLTQLLGDFELTDGERHRVATLLEGEAGKLQNMVGVLLDLERLPLRDFDAESAIVDVGDLVRTRVEFLRAATDRTILVTVENRLAVRADAALIERAIDNLVGNALKYTTAPAPVTVRVARAGGQAVIDVEDRGPGIAPADQSRIFERFVRGTTAAGTQGLGLGLALVAEIARWHGGEISLDTATGGGARFRIALPLVQPAARAGAM